MISFSPRDREDQHRPTIRLFCSDEATDQGQAITLRLAYERFKRTPRDKRTTVEAYHNMLSHWESLTSNPDVRDIQSWMLEEFKEAFLARENPHSKSRGKYSPATWKKIKTHFMAVLNRCGPQGSHNRYGRGIIDQVPIVEPVKCPRRPPRIATRDQVSTIYEACAGVTWPRNLDFAAELWWQTLIVWLFNIGSRRNDFLNLRWSQLDLERRILTSDEGKTDKVLPKPLNATVLQHLLAIHSDRELVFPKSRGTRMLYKHWYAIQARAGIAYENRFCFHELRKTCCTAYYERSPGAAQEIMGHSDMSTTRASYWAPSRHLAEMADDLEQPSAFKAKA